MALVLAMLAFSIALGLTVHRVGARHHAYLFVFACTASGAFLFLGRG